MMLHKHRYHIFITSHDFGLISVVTLRAFCGVGVLMALESARRLYRVAAGYDFGVAASTTHVECSSGGTFISGDGSVERSGRC